MDSIAMDNPRGLDASDHQKGLVELLLMVHNFRKILTELRRAVENGVDSVDQQIFDALIKDHQDKNAK